MKILWKCTVATEYRVIRRKLCGNCAFPQNFHTRKLVEITVFCAVLMNNKQKHISDTVEHTCCNCLLKERTTFNIIMVFMTKSIAHKPSIISCEVSVVYTNRLVRYISWDLAEVLGLSLFSCGAAGTNDIISFS